MSFNEPRVSQPLNIMFNAKHLARQTALATALIANFEQDISDEVDMLFGEQQQEMPDHVSDMWNQFHEDDEVTGMTGRRTYHA